MDQGPGRATLFRSKIPFKSTLKLASEVIIAPVGTITAQCDVARARFLAPRGSPLPPTPRITETSASVYEHLLRASGPPIFGPRGCLLAARNLLMSVDYVVIK